MNIAKILTNRGFQVLLAISLYFCFANQLPSDAHAFFYSLSLLIKDSLLWFLPIGIGFFIAYTVCSFRQSALVFVVAILAFEMLSNFCSVWYAYACGHLAGNFLPPMELPTPESGFHELWRMPWQKPSWWGADKGTILGFVFGCIGAFTENPFLLQKITQGKNIAQWVLTRIFSRLIPVFILGFVARMRETHALENVASHYAVLLVWLVLLLASYLACLFLLGAKGSISQALQALRNLLPAGGIAFTSGCSLSTMPWTIAGAAKNMHDPEFAQAVIPATTNIQQIGDCITNTFLCFLVYKHFYGHAPDVATWLQFSIVFVLARFATAAVLGGALFIMLPIYEHYLHFSPEMIAIIVAFNVILDPLITFCNVMANGALCPIFEKVWRFLEPSQLREKASKKG